MKHRLTGTRRRGNTILVGCALLVLLLFSIDQVPVPYVELAPGPTVDTLGKSGDKPVISVEGIPTRKSDGQLRLVTVQVDSDLNLLSALRGWLAGDDAVVPRELVYPPNKSEKDVDNENAQEFEDSQSSAETAALRELGYPVQVTVTKLTKGLPAANVLKVGDVITAVDGTTVTSAQKLSTLVREKPAGTARKVTYQRGGQTRTETVGTALDKDGNVRLGVEVEPRQPHPFKLSIELDQIGGPSAGLMFALGIIDKIGKEDLTGGSVIAGTGTIDDEGGVGPIGGIPQKLVAAKAAGAKVFLTPTDNCAEAVANAQPNLPLIKVGSLDQALDALRALREHRTPQLCSR